MFGTRDLFSKGEKINEVADRLLEGYVEQLIKFSEQDSNENFSKQDATEKQEECKKFLEEKLQEASKIFYLKRLYQQGKQISQIIAYIWRWADAEENPQQDIANKLKEYFTNPTEDNQKPAGKLKKLLKADPKKTETSEEAKLLHAVFFENETVTSKNVIFPMFNEFELGEMIFGDKIPDLGYLFSVNINSFQGTIQDPTKNARELMQFNIPYPPRPQLGKTTVTTNDLESWIANREENKFFADNPYIPTTCS